MTRRAQIGLALSIVISFGIGFLVGSLLGVEADWPAIATAVGTLGLAAATFYLAMQTRSVVDASRAEAKAARDDLEVAREQAETARKSLDAQTKPFLTVGDTTAGVLGPGAAHVRNAGNGTAVVVAVVFYNDSVEHYGSAVDPAVPKGETTSVILLPPGGVPAIELDAGGNFSVAVAFNDVDGTARGAVRLDVYKRPGTGGAGVYQAQDRWWVRQVFWADTLEAVRENPTFGTQPYEAP